MIPTESAAAPDDDLGLVIELLGGEQQLGQAVLTPLDVHHLIVKGFSNKTLNRLVSHVPLIQDADLMERALGIGIRTYQRRKKASHEAALTADQSGRLWNFAEVLAKASRVFGSQKEAEDWLNRPAMGLDRQKPIDLLTTPAGVGLVTDHLERLEHGVYS